MEEQKAVCNTLRQQIAQQRVVNQALEAVCLAIERYCLYGQLENCRNESELKYKQLVQKQVSAEEEKKMEKKIQQKLGGIDAILQKAAKVNPNIFSDEEAKAAALTIQKTTQIIEESKQKKDTSLTNIFLKELKKSGQQDSVKPILRKTKEEVKALVRKREAARNSALKSMKQKLSSKQVITVFQSDNTFQAFDQAA